MERVNMDFVGKDSSSGPLADMLANTGLDVGKLRPFIHKDGKPYVTVFTGGNPQVAANYKTMLVTNATLRRDEWKQLDDAIQQISRFRLGGIDDLVSNGLVFNLGNGMGTTVLETHNVSDAMEAVMTMDGLTRGQNDRPDYETKYLPIPIIHVDYQINSRVLEASRKLGNPLDTTSAEYATRKVREKLESLLFTDETYTFGGGVIYSYLNHPDRNTDTLTTDWDDIAVTGALLIADVLTMKQTSIDNLHFGPWMLYIPTIYETKMDADYDATTPGTTIRERILKIDGIKGVKVIDTLTADNVLLVQMTPDTVRLVKGMDIQNVEWKQEGNFVTNYKVMTIQVPQVRSDQAGKSGIVHMS